MADLRAEAERERAGARLAAQTARERDGARADRDEATRERNAARAERDSAVQERNRMLAERDTAQTRIEEVARQWELTAGRGTRRTLERDTALNERDHLARERDQLARERDITVEERDRVALEQAEATSEWREPLDVSEQELVSHDPALPPLGDDRESGVWRARVLAVSALLVAAIVLLVLALAR